MRGRQREQPRERPRERGPALPAAVGALCRALPPRARPAPDTLRRARFDRPQASLDFWRLLYVLLKQIHGGRWTESDAIGAQVGFVKWALWYHGYGRPQLQRLPADGSAGSRELLLAFSWLLHSPGLLEQLLARNRVQTGDETSVCTACFSMGNMGFSKSSRLFAGCPDVEAERLLGRIGKMPGKSQSSVGMSWALSWADRWQLTVRKEHLWGSQPCHLHVLQQCRQHGLFCSIACTGHSEFIKCEDDLPESQEGTSEAGPEDRVDVRYLQWLNGRLRLQWCSLHAQHQEQCKLLHKLLQLLESETTQLEAFLEWKQLEPVYWQWMETVLDDMAEEGNMCESQDAHVEKRRLPEVTSCCPWADKLAGQMDRLSRDLLALQQQLHQLVAQRKAAWWEKVATREELQKDSFSATARKIQGSVELKLRDLTSLCAPQKNRMHGLCRLVLRSKHPASTTGCGQRVSREAVVAASAAEVIRELQVREASLQRELQQLRQQCRHRLAGIAEGWEGVICISP
ncbi:tubulin epsilon and delta complex protein 1 isoform X2 [Passer domesticus]|uniref:tubulin epsilon and delta complex protein 1 isoform X2 n=1 Tax=Passer domesticus TaxID=48849 RepID=UPI0030FE69F2